MQDRAKLIFGNQVSKKAYKKAVQSKKKYRKKFGDDSQKDYKVHIVKNPYIGDSLGVQNLLIGDLKSNAHYDPKNLATQDSFDLEKGIVVANIRMGFGHYRISMAMASVAKAMGYTPYWMDLNSYGETDRKSVV